MPCLTTELAVAATLDEVLTFDRCILLICANRCNEVADSTISNRIILEVSFFILFLFKDELKVIF
jgi:hypothetical protein